MLLFGFDCSSEVVHEHRHAGFTLILRVHFFSICRTGLSTLVKRIMTVWHVLNVQKWSDSIRWSWEGSDRSSRLRVGWGLLEHVGMVVRM